MPIHTSWRYALLLLVTAAFAAPALAQQPAPTQTPPVAPEAKKPPKPKPKPKPADAAAPAPAADQAPTAAEAKKPPKPKPKPADAAPAAATPAPPQTTAVAGGVKPTLLGQYGEWGAYTASPGGKKICFAIAKPTASETNPPNRPRNPTYMFISTRPGDKVSNEVSFIIGYPFKANTEAMVEVGTTSYALYTQQDGAWIKNATEEARLIESMRAGQSAVVKGVSTKGTKSTDTFSLKGLAQALDRTGQDCK